MECLFAEFVSKIMCGNLYSVVYSEKSLAVLGNGFFSLDSWELQQFWMQVLQVFFNGNGVQWNTVLILTSLRQIEFLGLVSDCWNLSFAKDLQIHLFFH